MPSSGSGSGTPVSTSGVAATTVVDAWPNKAVTLARYAQIIGYDEAAFWGVYYDGQEQFECYTMWTEWQRRSVADALAQAEQMIEDVLGYFLTPTWVTGSYVDDARTVDQQAAVGNPLVTRWGMLIQAGVRAEATIQANAVVDYSDEDVAVIGPITTTVTDADEVKVFHAGSEREISPSRIRISGGQLTIFVPRARLVSPDLLLTIRPQEGLVKTDTANFVTVVDVKRIYNDPSTNAQLVKTHDCSTICSLEGCSTQTDAGCITIINPILGIVRAHPGTYSNGWSESIACCTYNHVRLNYQAGLRQLTTQVENMVVRLAHALMPEEPCGCDVVKRLWMRDHKTPDIMTREMLNNPFGYQPGAIFAYQWAANHARVIGDIA